MKRDILINEIEEAKKIISGDFEINEKDAFLLMKYFFYIHKKPKPTRLATLEVIEKRSQSKDYLYLKQYVLKNISKVRKYKIRDGNMKIGFSNSELKKISHLPHKIYRTLVYMLVVSRYEKYKQQYLNLKKKRDFGLYFNHSLSDAFKYCRVNMTKKEIKSMSYFLCGESGLLKPSLSSADRWQIMFAVDEGKRFDHIIDTSKDVLLQIPYFCLRCGNVIDKKSDRHEMCEPCYKVVRKRKTVIKVRKHREKQNVSVTS